MTATLGRLIVYTKKLDAMAEFYCRHFGFVIVELRQRGSGISMILHPASKRQKEGQSLIKRGLNFGPVHHVDGYSFANAKDPSNNSISVSSRAHAA